MNQDNNNNDQEKSQKEEPNQEQKKQEKEDKIKCSWCGKEFPRKDLTLVWDNGNNGWHYCHGTWRYNYYSDYHCCNHSDRPLFLCKPCYQIYKQRKIALEKDGRNMAKMIIFLVFFIILTTFISIFIFWWLPWSKRRW